MARFLTIRLMTSILSLLVVTSIIFFVSRVYGDPINNFIPDEGYGLQPEEIKKVKERLHLDRAVPVQYAFWIGDLLRGDLGEDLRDRHPIAPKLRERIWPTVQLAGLAFIVATCVGIPLGVLAAYRRGTPWDYGGRLFAVIGHSLPSFWVGIVAILVFSVMLKWLPSATQGIDGINWKNYIMPTLVLAWLPMAGYTRLVRSSMLEILDSEFVKLARAKGVSTRGVVWRHGLRNATIAPLTFAGVLLAGLVSGSVAVETVFAWPGIARWGVTAVYSNNLNVLSIVTLVFTVFYVVASFLVDVLYVYVDPRIRYS